MNSVNWPIDTTNQPMINQLFITSHFRQWSWLIPWVFGLSVIAFIGSIIGVWFVLIRLPEDYLTRDDVPEPNDTHRSAGWLIRKIAKNLGGMVFLIAGMVMLFTPGQGILSVLVGITMLDFPGKRKLIRKILTRPRVLKAINKLRNRSNVPPLRVR